MRPIGPVALTLLTVATLGYNTEVAVTQEVDYNKAERLLSWHTSRMVSGDQVDPNWFEDGRRFWYRNSLGEGHEFIFVDPSTTTRRQLFDHHRLASAMSLADDTSYVGTKLPFDDFDSGEELRTIEFNARKKRFTCDIVQYSCTVSDTLPSDTPYVESPDGAWEVFVVDYDLYVRPKGGGDSVRVTTEGEEFNSYGLNYARPSQVRNERPRRPSVSWSPDSRRLAVTRQDERDVEHHHYLSMTPQRPVHYSYPYALPGDSIIPFPAIHIVTLEMPMSADGDEAHSTLPKAVGNVAVEFPERPLQSSFAGSIPDSAWSNDGSKLYVASTNRAFKDIWLSEVDVTTGSSRVVAHESGKTYVEMGHGRRLDPSSWYVFENNDVLWWS